MKKERPYNHFEDFLARKRPIAIRCSTKKQAQRLMVSMSKYHWYWCFDADLKSVGHLNSFRRLGKYQASQPHYDYGARTCYCNNGHMGGYYYYLKHGFEIWNFSQIYFGKYACTEKERIEAWREEQSEKYLSWIVLYEDEKRLGHEISPKLQKCYDVAMKHAKKAKEIK